MRSGWDSKAPREEAETVAERGAVTTKTKRRGQVTIGAVPRLVETLELETPQGRFDLTIVVEDGTTQRPFFRSPVEHRPHVAGLRLLHIYSRGATDPRAPKTRTDEDLAILVR